MSRNHQKIEIQEEPVWRAWPVSWSGIWVGTLTALAVLVVIGLIAVAVGAQLTGPSQRILSSRDYGILALVFSIAGAFFSFVAGGWAAARVAGIYRAETAMLHGAISWLVAVPLLIALTALGSGSVFGTWYGGLSGVPARVSVSSDGAVRAAPATAQLETEAAQAARNAALGSLTALILGLVGSALGGWMASKEPMNFAYYRLSAATARADERTKTGNSELVSSRS